MQRIRGKRCIEAPFKDYMIRFFAVPIPILLLRSVGILLALVLPLSLRCWALLPISTATNLVAVGHPVTFSFAISTPLAAFGPCLVLE
jgi:hypothetical protein